MCEYVQKAKPEHSDFHGEGVVTIRATGYLNESKMGKKYIGLNLEPDYKTMKAIEESDLASPEWKSSPKVPDKKEEEFPF